MEERAQHATWVNAAKGRYYQVHLGQDLFGDWTLLKVWGGCGSRRGRLHSSGVASYADGLTQLRAIAKRRATHGYLSQDRADSSPASEAPSV